MTPEQEAAALTAIQRRAQVQFSWDAWSAVAKIDATFSTDQFEPTRGRPRDVALQQVINRIKGVAKELEEIGV